MAKLKDYSNKRFGRITVKTFAFRKNKETYWNCICKCGKEKSIKIKNLQRGKIKSCGCWRIENNRRNGLLYGKKKTHGESRNSLYRKWNAMKHRCHSPKNIGYKDYGAKGIHVCKEWIGSYENFRDWALTHGYKEGLTIERMNNREGYNPSNCKFIPWSEQNKNKGNMNMNDRKRDSNGRFTK